MTQLLAQALEPHIVLAYKLADRRDLKGSSYDARTVAENRRNCIGGSGA